MSQRKIIGLVGPKGSGKSSLAWYLFKQEFTVRSLAEPLKEMLWELLEIQGVDQKTIIDLITGKGKELPTEFFNGKSPRHAMQTLGTEWGRNCIDQSFWLNIWARRIAPTSENIVCDDVRFQNEVELIRTLGGKIIRIIREGQITSDSHISEQEFSSIIADHTITNYENNPHLMFEQLRDYISL